MTLTIVWPPGVWESWAREREKRDVPQAQELRAPDEFEKYVRKVRAANPHFDLDRARAFASFGFQCWKRAAAANRRADEAERLLGELADAPNKKIPASP